MLWEMEDVCVDVNMVGSWMLRDVNIVGPRMP